jgi:hypothetical protein
VSGDQVLHYCGSIDPTDRRAAGLAWSQIAHLENLGIIVASLVGDAQQVADEQRHVALFEEMARRCDVTDVEPVEATIALETWLMNLPVGEARLAMNAIAENLFATMFETMIDEGVAPMTLKRVLADERRHVNRPIGQLPSPNGVAAVVAELEDLIENLLFDPAFTIPLARLIGARGLARIGVRLSNAHAVTCHGLGLQPGLRRVRARALAHLSHHRRDPTPLTLTPYEAARVTWWRSAAEASQVIRGCVPLRNVGTYLTALGRCLEREPTRRVVYRAGRLYRVERPQVGVRLATDAVAPAPDWPGRPAAVETVRLRPQYLTAGETARLLATRRGQLMIRPYVAPPDVRGLEDLLPPSEMVAWFAWLRDVPGSSGHGPLIDAEGATFSLTLGGPTGGTVWYELVADHRAVDGAVLTGLAADWEREVNAGG